MIRLTTEVIELAEFNNKPMSHPNPMHDQSYSHEGSKPSAHSRALNGKIDQQRKQKNRKHSASEMLMRTAYKTAKSLPGSRPGYRKP